jgi:hypothetical protein
MTEGARLSERRRPWTPGSQRSPVAAFVLLSLSAVTAAPALARDTGDDGEPAAPRAEIVLVGPESATRPVREVVDELLSRDGVAVSWSARDRLRVGEIVETPPARAAATTFVWIDLSSPVEARVYFRDAAGQRFIIRAVSLQPELAALAVEEIAQIVKSVLRALGAGTVRALSLTEARAALGEARTPPQSPAPPSPTRQTSAEIGTAALGQLYAPQLNFVGRIDASVAVISRRAAGAPVFPGTLGGCLAFGYGLPARFEGETIGADLRTLSVRAGVVWEPWRRGPTTIRLGLGGGLDRVEYRPTTAVAGAALAPPGDFLAPIGWVAAEVRLEILDRLALVAGAVAEASMSGDHFDAYDQGGARTQVLVPFGVRPGLSLGAVWRL